MRRIRLALLLTAGLAPAALAAQAPLYPPGLVARGVALNAECRASGGQAVNGPKPLVVIQHDLTGDGRREFILDEGAFACSSGLNQLTTAGAPIEVFDGATGRSLYRGVAASWQVLQGPRPQVVLTLRGSTCSPNAMATTTCQRPLAWNAQARNLAGPQEPLNRGGSAAQPPARAAPVNGPPPTATSRLALTEADKAAVLKAAGFKLVRGVWKRCEEETPTASYEPGAVEEVLDLNADGRPEVVVTESSLFCHGQQGSWFAILSKDASGSWRQVLESDGVFVALPTRANGWREVMVSGPGFTHPAYRYNGKEYARNRMVRE